MILDIGLYLEKYAHFNL